MGSVDSIPIVSQIKSAVQAIAGDTIGAKKTQENFVNGCPVVSQMKSLVQVIGHDPEGARNTQKIFLRGMGDMADGIPVIGHVKGVVQYIMGDTEAGDRSMKAASRTIGVLGGTIAGFLIAGPFGAAFGGALLGFEMDKLITEVDSAVHHEYRPYGEIAAITNMVNGHHSSGEIFDFVAGVGLDALAGVAQGMDGSISHPLNFETVYRVANDQAVNIAKKKNKLPQPFQGNEVWISQNLTHSKEFQVGDPVYRSRNVMVIDVDKTWYRQMKKNDLVDQHNQQARVQWQNRPMNRGRNPNLWNNERLQSNNPTNGRVNIGIKTHGTFKVRQIQKVSNIIKKTLEEIKDLNEAQHANRLIYPMRKLFQESVDQQLMESYQEYQPKIDQIRNQLSQSLQQNNLVLSKNLLCKADGVLDSFLKKVEKQTNNLYMFNKHIWQIQTIDITKWPYSRIGKSMRFIAKHGRYAGALITCWGPKQHSGQREKGNQKIHQSGTRAPSTSLASYSNANTTQVYKAQDAVLYYFSEQPQPIVKGEINIGGLIPKNIVVAFLAKSKLKNSQVILRLWKYSQTNQHIDVLMTSKGFGEGFGLYEYKASEDKLKYLEIGGALQVLGIAGKEEGSILQVRQLQVRIDYGEPIAQIKHQGQNTIFTFQNPFTVSLTGVQKDQLQELFAQTFPCQGYNVYSQQVCYQSILKGTQAQIFLMLEMEGAQKLSGVIPISKVFQNGQNWKTHDQTYVGLKIPEGSNLRLVAKVKHGEQLWVKNMKLNLCLRPKSQRVQNKLNFERVQQIFKYGNTDQLIDLFPQTFYVALEISNIRISFIAKDQGHGNRKGKVFLSIYRNKIQPEENILLTPQTAVQHDWKQYFFNSYDLKTKILKGDNLKIRCIVGDGGGHQLFVKDFFFFMTYRHSIRVFTPYTHFFSENNNDEIQYLYPEKIACGINAVLGVRISFKANDQGQGNRKGRIYMRINQGGKILQHVLLVDGDGIVDHKQKDYVFVSESIGERIPPGSVLEFMAYCGTGGGHKLHVSNFKAQVTFSDHPRDELVVFKEMEWSASKKIWCLSKVKQVTIDGQFVDERRQKVNLLVVAKNGIKRNLIQILNNNNLQGKNFSIKIPEAELNSRIAMTDRIQIAKQGPENKSLFKNFALRVKFGPLQFPYHEALTIQFSPQILWKAQDGKESINVVGQNHGFQIGGRLLSVIVSCIWKDNQNKVSTGKFFLIQKSKEGHIKSKLDVFGTVNHKWCKMLARYESDSKIVRKSQPGDQLFLEREVGQNGELYVDHLEIVLIVAP